MWNLALVLEQQGERNWAEKLYERIPEDAPESCDASFRLGYLRLLRGDYAASADGLPELSSNASRLAGSLPQRRHRVRPLAAIPRTRAAISRKPS